MTGASSSAAVDRRDCQAESQADLANRERPREPLFVLEQFQKVCCVFSWPSRN